LPGGEDAERIEDAGDVGSFLPRLDGGVVNSSRTPLELTRGDPEGSSPDPRARGVHLVPAVQILSEGLGRGVVGHLMIPRVGE
jgi:hypothetical protein